MTQVSKSSSTANFEKVFFPCSNVSASDQNCQMPPKEYSDLFILSVITIWMSIMITHLVAGINNEII